MSNAAIVALLCLGIASCATHPPQGNHVQHSAADQQKLAVEAVTQLASIWPPAKTRLALQQPTPDPFGMALVKGLRDKGYALVEFNQATGTTPPDHPTGSPISTSIPLRYVLDHAGAQNLYRLTLSIGTQTLSRPYLEQGGVLVPAGYWTRQE